MGTLLYFLILLSSAIVSGCASVEHYEQSVDLELAATPSYAWQSTESATKILYCESFLPATQARLNCLKNYVEYGMAKVNLLYEFSNTEKVRDIYIVHRESDLPTIIAAVKEKTEGQLHADAVEALSSLVLYETIARDSHKRRKALYLYQDSKARSQAFIDALNVTAQTLNQINTENRLRSLEQRQPTYSPSPSHGPITPVNVGPHRR